LKLIAIYDDVSTKTSWEKQAIPRGQKKTQKQKQKPSYKVNKNHRDTRPT